MESVDVFNIFRSEFVEYRINSVLLVIAERFIILNIEWMSFKGRLFLGNLQIFLWVQFPCGSESWTDPQIGDLDILYI